MFTTSTSTMTTAGVVESPPPRWHEPAMNISIVNGSVRLSSRRYDRASAGASPWSCVRVTIGRANVTRPRPTTAPINTAAETDWPTTRLASRRCLAPRARLMMAVLPVPTEPTSRPMNHRK